MVTEDGEVINAVREVFFRTGWNYDRDSASNESAVYCRDESKTDQSMKDEADINTIVRRFGLTGQLPHDVKMPTYADLTAVPSFHEAMQLVAEAREAFMEMPADVRTRFGNDAGAFADFCSDPANAEEMVKLGVAVKREPVVESVQKVEIVNPPPGDGSAKG